MRVFAYVLAAHAFVFGIGATANAADMFSMEDEACESWKDPCEKPALWSGLYVGGFVGGGWGNTDITDVYDYDGDPIAKNSIRHSPFLAGVNLGYNVQKGSFVYGIEGALGFMNLKGSVKDNDLRPEEGAGWDEDAWGKRDKHMAISGTYDISGNFYGELTGRLGYARDNALLYLKGGAAFVNASFDAHYSGDNWCTGKSYNSCLAQQSTFDFGKSDTLIGWTLGLGFEYALSNSMSLRAEYQHFDFGTISYQYKDSYVFKTNGWASNLSGDVDADVTLDVVKLGINYKLQDQHDSLK